MVTKQFERQFSDEQVREIFILKSQGRSFLSIAKQFGVYESSIWKMINRQTYRGVDVPDVEITIKVGGRRGQRSTQRRFTDDQVREMRRMASDGMSHVAIAHKFDCLASVVSHIVCRRVYKDVPDSTTESSAS